MIGNDIVRQLDRRFRSLEESAVRYRQGVVAGLSPLTVKLGGADIAIEVAVVGGVGPLAVDDVVSVLTFGNDAVVLGTVATEQRSYQYIGAFTKSSTELSYSSIPQTFRHLQIRCVGQSDASAVANINWRMRFNGSTALYHNYGFWTQTNLGGSSLRSQSWFLIGSVPGASRTSDNMVSHVTIDIPFYAATNQVHQYHCRWSGDDGTNTLFGTAYGSFVQNTTAVTSISLFDNGGNNLGPRASAELWGIS